MVRGLDNLPEIPPTETTVTVLSVSPFSQDHQSLRAIFRHSNWRIYEARGCREAMEFLRHHEMAVVVCESCLPDGGWKSLFESIGSLAAPPLLIVSARDANDDLWAEALNLGAYDVLWKPFHKTEVIRIVSLAWLYWKENHASACVKRR